MWQFGVIIFVFFEIVQIQSAIPAYFKPCSKSKGLKDCAIKHGNEMLPSLLKGDSEIKIPNLIPLKLSNVDVKSGPNLKINLADVEVHGLETVTLTDADIDLTKSIISLSLHAERLQIIGKYEVDGKILVLPITGSGPCNITVVDGQFNYVFSYKLKKRDGIEYAIIQEDDKLEYTIAKVHIHLDNLFNGNQLLGDNVNKFLNENDQEVLKELGGTIEGTVTSVGRTVGGGLLWAIPFHELFLD